jgi:YedE family putative selenium metabolism protein
LFFGFSMMVGSAIFIGCPLKVFLRLAGGDVSALFGMVGLIVGVFLGLKGVGATPLGMEAKRREMPFVLGLFPVVLVAIFAGVAFIPGLLLESTGGGGSLHAPRYISLIAGLILGVLAQGSRFCITGQIKDVALSGRIGNGVSLFLFFLAALGVNLLTEQFNFGYYDQPGVHLEWWWSFLGMGLVGFVAILSGGCPFRQIIKAGEGDMDALTVSVGMVLGAILVETWGLGATVSGVPVAGKVALLGSLAVVALLYSKKELST